MTVKWKTKYVANIVNLTDSLYKHAIKYNDITDTPHTHFFNNLFNKSDNPVARAFRRIIFNPKSEFCARQ